MDTASTSKPTKGRKVVRVLQIHLFTAGISDGAHHKQSHQQHEERQRQGRNDRGVGRHRCGPKSNSIREATVAAAAGTGRPTKSLLESLCARCKRGFGNDVKTRQPHGGTQEIDESNEPADDPEPLETLRRRKDEKKHHQGRGHAERYDIGKRVELGAEQRFATSQACQAAVQRIERSAPKIK